MNQTLVNFQVTLAFKRFKVEITNPRITEQEFRNLQNDAIINELIVLSNRPIYEHVNTADFVGLCFEISPTAVSVWPVLVFTKATQGDLGTMMNKGNQHGSVFLLGVCTVIAKGIYILHKCGKSIQVWR